MENYKQKYKEALETARKINSGEGVAAPEGWNMLEVIFPELKKSEDERIREEILNCFVEMKKQGCFPSKHKEQYDSWISWLEKQGEKEKTPCDRCRKEQPSHSCQYITSLGRCYMEGEQKPMEEAVYKWDAIEKKLVKLP